MSPEHDTRLRHEKGLMALSAAIMFAAAAAIDLIETAIPGGQSFSLAPGFGALGFAVALALFGARLPRWTLAALGPVGVAMIAYALASTKGRGDGAVLYMWPVLWESYFFGRRGAVAIVACVGLAHGLALAAMPEGAGNLDSWVDVIASVVVVAAVVEVLSERNRRLLGRISGEARVDELTGLLNRRGLDERAAVELARCRRDRGWLAAVAIDLDRFKQVNDEFGHEAGDRVLTRLAGCLRAEARETDVIARMGGEEFLALLPGSRLEEARAFAERVREALRSSAGPGAPRVTLSAGASAALAPAELGTLLKRADMALYTAKSQGRDRTAVDRPGALGGSGDGAGPRAGVPRRSEAPGRSR